MQYRYITPPTLKKIEHDLIFKVIFTVNTTVRGIS